jgi:hypothetical protein
VAYTKPVTFASSAVLAAADLESNLSALRDYTNSGIVAGDLVDGSIEAKHLRRPEFYQSGTIWGARMPSGEIHGLKNPPVGLTYDDSQVSSGGANPRDKHEWPAHFNGCMAIPLHQDKSDSPASWLPIPKTGRSFYMDSKGDAFIQWTIKLMAPYDNTAVHSTPATPNESKFRLFVDGTSYPVTEGQVLEHAGTDAGTYGRTVSICKMVKGLTRGDHDLWLGCGLKSNFVMCGGSQIIIEIEYDRS